MSTGTDFVARAAKARGFREIGQFLEFVPGEQRREHGADRTRIDAAVGVAGGLAIDGTDIEARTAADAAEDFFAIGGQHFGAAVVDEDDVHLLRAGRTVGAARTVDEFGVDGELLSGGGTPEQIEQDREVGVGRHDFLDADQRDVDFGRGEAEARIAFVGHQHEASGVGGDEIGAGDPRPGFEVFRRA